jgi:hypothetical protein
MKRQVRLIVLLLYAAAALADCGYRLIEAKGTGERIGPALLAVTFCAALFWPIDIVARPLLAPD